MSPLLGMALSACAPPVSPVAFTVSGPVDDGVSVEARAYVAWAWVADGLMDGTVEEVESWRSEDGYGIEVPPPPPRSAGDGSRPATFDAPDGASVVGVLMLVEPDSAEPQLGLDPGLVWGWALGDDVDPATAIGIVGGRWVAWAPEYLVAELVLDGVDRAGSDGDRVAVSPAWPPDGDLCRFDAGVLGFTVYRGVSDGCSGWIPLAAPRARTWFQGIPMVPAPGGEES